MIYIDIGKRLKEARDKAGRTQGDWGHLTGLSQSHISKIELGKTRPPIEYVIMAAEEANVSADWLLFGKESIPNLELVEAFVQEIMQGAVEAAKMISGRKGIGAHLQSQHEAEKPGQTSGKE